MYIFLNEQVYSKYRPCQNSFKVQYCTCSLYIRVNKTNPHFAFIDFCSSSVMSPPVLEFRYYQDVEQIEYPKLDCSVKIKNSYDEAEWNKVPTSFNYFKCAKLDSFCNTYIVNYAILINLSFFLINLT